jgi:hypothetical protein
MSFLSVPSEWVNYGAAFTVGFAFCLVISLRKQPIQNLQALNWKSGDLLKFTFGPQLHSEESCKAVKSLSPRELEGAVNALLIDLIKKTPVRPLS